jgi:nucleoid-associated protein EbfC
MPRKSKVGDLVFLRALCFSEFKKFSMSGFNLQELMSQAKQQYETLQKKMEQTVVESSSGGGTVTVKMDGRRQVLAIKIDPEAVKAGDVEMLQDLVMAALNDASRKVDQAMQSSVGGMLGGLGIGGL